MLLLLWPVVRWLSDVSLPNPASARAASSRIILNCLCRRGTDSPTIIPSPTLYQSSLGTSGDVAWDVFRLFQTEREGVRVSAFAGPLGDQR